MITSTIMTMILVTFSTDTPVMIDTDPAFHISIHLVKYITDMDVASLTSPTGIFSIISVYENTPN